MNRHTQTDQAVDDFITQLLKAKGLDTLVGETREDVAAELKGKFLEYLNMVIISSLPDDKLTEVAALDSELAPDELRRRIDEIVAGADLDIEVITTKATKEFADTYLKDEEERT
jgi:hypothetical protein